MAEIIVENITPEVYTDDFVVDCARVSFNKRADHYTPNQNKRLINYLFNPPDSVPHWAPFAGARIEYTLSMHNNEMLEFMLKANLRGFVIVEQDPEVFTLNGSLWAWYENVKRLPIRHALAITSDLAHKFPVCSEVFGWRPLNNNHIENTKNIKVHNLRFNAPIFVARQLGKHQVDLVWSEVSRRYISSEPELWWPKEWHKAPTHSKQGASTELYSFEDYTLLGKNFNPEFEMGEQQFKEMVEDLVITYNLAITSGMAPEEARMILPQNMMTEWIWTGTDKAFDRILRERLAPGAQKSGTRETAEKIKEVLKK